jgi:hypothetical protein
MTKKTSEADAEIDLNNAIEKENIAVLDPNLKRLLKNYELKTKSSGTKIIVSKASEENPLLPPSSRSMSLAS